MANLQIYDDSASIITVFSTTLNSLAPTAQVVNNVSPGGELFCDLELLVQYTSATPTVGEVTAEIYFCPSVDGTNYPVCTTTTGIFPPIAQRVAQFHSRAPSTSTTERLAIFKVELPVRTFNCLLVNTSGQTWASSGNTLKIKPYGYNLNH